MTQALWEQHLTAATEQRATDEASGRQRYTPFTNGSSWDFWEERNCAQCAKSDTNDAGWSDCPLLNALFEAQMMDGSISLEVAQGVGYVGQDGVEVSAASMFICTQLVRSERSLAREAAWHAANEAAYTAACIAIETEIAACYQCQKPEYTCRNLVHTLWLDVAQGRATVIAVRKLVTDREALMRFARDVEILDYVLPAIDEDAREDTLQKLYDQARNVIRKAEARS